MGRLVLLTTAEHPFWVVGRGWSAVHELQVGERLLMLDGLPVALEGVQPTTNWEVA